MSVQQLLKQAEQLHSSGDLAQAAELYQQVLGIKPFDAETQHNLGVLAYQLNNYPLADDLISKAIEASSKTNGIYWLNLGLVRLAKQDYPSAEELLSKAYQLEPHNINIIVALGNCCLATQNVAVAEQHYREAIALASQSKPVSPAESTDGGFSVEPSVVSNGVNTARNNLGFILLQRGRLAEAETVLKQAIDLSPNFNAYLNLGTCYSQGGNDRDGIACFKAAEELALGNQVPQKK